MFWLTLLLLLVGTCSGFIDFDHFDVGVDQWNQGKSNERLTFLRFSDSQFKKQFLPRIFSPLHFVKPFLPSENTELSNSGGNLPSMKKDDQDLHVPFKTISKKPKQNFFIPEFTIHVNGDPLKKVAGHVTTFDTFMADHASDTVSPLLSFFKFLVSTMDAVVSNEGINTEEDDAAEILDPNMEDILAEIFEKDNIKMFDSNVEKHMDSPNSVLTKDIKEDYEGGVIDPALDVLDEIFKNDDIEISNLNADKHIGSPNSILTKDMQEDYEDRVIDPTLDDIWDEIIENVGIEMLNLNADKNIGSPNSILIKDMEEDKVVDRAFEDALDKIFEIAGPNVDKPVGSANSILIKNVQEDHEDEGIDPALDDILDVIFENDDTEPTIVLLH